MIQTDTLTAQITEWLSERIIEGEFRPGQPILENDVAERLGVSRSPLREALRILEREGMIRIVPRRGAVVELLSEKDAGDLYECRMHLESLCTRLAAEALRPPELERLQSVLTMMEAAASSGDFRQYQARNAEFHLVLYSFCPNETIVELIQLLWRRTLRYRRLLAMDPERVATSLEGHRRLMEDLLAGSPDGAEQTMRELIGNAAKSLRAHIQRNGVLASVVVGSAKGEVS